MNTIGTLIERLGLQPHPEGGYYRETYRSCRAGSEAGEPGTTGTGRYWSTCIYYLLTGDTFSAFHRIKQDEIWHFYDGSALVLHLLGKTGEYSSVRLGRDLERGEVPQYVIPGGTWFAAETTMQDSFSLAGCTVSPGFEFSDFELADADELEAVSPGQKALIHRLTR